MSTTRMKTKPRPRLTAAEVRQLPPAKRSALWKAAAELAAPFYKKGGPLRDFDAFGEDDLHVDSSNTEAR